MIEKPSFADTAPIPTKISSILHNKPNKLLSSPKTYNLPPLR